ncbi:hypothetical protein B4144_4035 [Bacillus atrophaeus]|nr:hypothetical protein B4144_4035 [Bacillus atrophaeus]
MRTGQKNSPNGIKNNRLCHETFRNALAVTGKVISCNKKEMTVSTTNTTGIMTKQ